MTCLDVEVHAFEDSHALAAQVAGALGAPCRRVSVRQFPDRESLVRVSGSAAGLTVLVRSLDDPNAKLVELLFAADALRRQGADPLVLLVPYLAYMRQDRAFHEGEAISQRVVGRWLGQAFDRILTVDPHLHRIRRLSEVVPCAAESLSAAEPIARWCRQEEDAGVLVGPDEESERWVRRIAAHASWPHVVCTKRRRGDEDVRVEIPPLPKGAKRAVVVDDIASSGATLATTARGLHRAGAERVDAVIVHALFDRATEESLHRAGIRQLVSTDSVTHTTNAIRLAPTFAAALRPHLPAARSA